MAEGDLSQLASQGNLLDVVKQIGNRNTLQGAQVSDVQAGQQADQLFGPAVLDATNAGPQPGAPPGSQGQGGLSIPAILNAIKARQAQGGVSPAALSKLMGMLQPLMSNVNAQRLAQQGQQFQEKQQDFQQNQGRLRDQSTARSDMDNRKQAYKESQDKYRNARKEYLDNQKSLDAGTKARVGVALQKMNKALSVLNNLRTTMGPADQVEKAQAAFDAAEQEYLALGYAGQAPAGAATAQGATQPAGGAATPQPQQGGDKPQFTEGTVYTDAQGNKATYQGGQFVPVQ